LFLAYVNSRDANGKDAEDGHLGRVGHAELQEDPKRHSKDEEVGQDVDGALDYVE
jgi:hypothetical protein